MTADDEMRIYLRILTSVVWKENKKYVHWAQAHPPCAFVKKWQVRPTANIFII